MDDPTTLAAAEIRRLAALVEGADMTTPVPTCPGWTLADLLDHIGTVNRWATFMVEHVSQQRATREDMDFDVPPDPSGLPQWLAEGADRLEKVFAPADPDAAMWSWGLDKHARFWPRRMVHETTIHRVDAELALGRTPTVDAAIAVDGIDELLDNIACASYFAPKVDELRGNGEVIQLQATDSGDGWRIELQPDRYEWRREAGSGAVTVRGAASDLLLLLYGRLARDDARLTIEGDPALLSFWIDRSAL